MEILFHLDDPQFSLLISRSESEGDGGRNFLCWENNTEWMKNWLLTCLFEHDIKVVRILESQYWCLAVVIDLLKLVGNLFHLDDSQFSLLISRSESEGDGGTNFVLEK